MATPQPRRAVAIAVAIFICIVAVAIHHLWEIKGFERLIDSDIYNVWKEGRKLSEGVNPYTRIIGQSMRDNDNYPTYLPLTYLFSAWLHRRGIEEFPDFIRIWRGIGLSCHLGLGLLTFHIYNRQHKPLAGLIAMSVLLLGRWSAYIIDVQHLEFPAVLAIVAACHQLNRRPWLSALLLSLSLSIKHIGILLLPCFLLGLNAEAVGLSTQARWFRAVRYCLIAFALPVALSLPFYFNSQEGFLLSMLFSASRGTSSHGIATGSEMILLSVDNTRLLMGGLFVMAWITQARQRMNVWFACTLTLLIFLQFNPVVYAQYYIWITAFLLNAFAYLTPPGRPEPAAGRTLPPEALASPPAGPALP